MVVFAPGGARLASGSWDGTAKVWDGTTGAVIHDLKGHTNDVRSVAFKPDGTQLSKNFLYPT
jgi:WD40 repeat protein